MTACLIMHMQSQHVFALFLLDWDSHKNAKNTQKGTPPPGGGGGGVRFCVFLAFLKLAGKLQACVMPGRG